MSRIHARLRLGAAALMVLSAGACEDSSDVELIEVEAIGAVFGQVFIDSNGNGAIDGGDAPFAGALVQLLAGVASQPVREEVTDTLGLFFMGDLPVGAYRVSLGETALGDSLSVIGEGIEIGLGRNDTTRVDLAATFPSLSLEAVRDVEPGRRVFTSGITLNPRQTFGDGLVHLKGGSSFLRMTAVERVFVNTGDSVRVLGRVEIDNGQPILTNVTPFVLVTLASIPIPLEFTTARAASADGGESDAALVRVRDAEILDTLTVGGDFTATIDDGSGPLTMVVRSFLQLATTGLQPDSIIRLDQAVGLLVARVDETGAQSWRLLPRGGADVLLEVKQADVGVDLRLSPAGDSTFVMGDSLDIVVVVTNNGPLRATGVVVSDTIPDLLDFVEARPTRGSYSAATSLWTVGDIEPGASDTLRLGVTVTTDSLAVLVNRAWRQPPLREVDVNSGNNVDQMIFFLVAPPAPVGGSGNR